ncbi:hypothetical protein ALC62_06870, partial [Cyphomyrmex costatus]
PRRSTVSAPIHHRSDTHAKTQVVCHEQILDVSTRERQRKEQEAREQRIRSCKSPPETQDSPISEGPLRGAIEKERYIAAEMNRKISNLEAYRCASAKSRIGPKESRSRWPPFFAWLCGL